MKRLQLAFWQRGDHGVAVELDGTDLVISRQLDGVVEEKISFPASRALLLSMREACDQALRVLA